MEDLPSAVSIFRLRFCLACSFFCCGRAAHAWALSLLPCLLYISLDRTAYRVSAMTPAWRMAASVVLNCEMSLLHAAVYCVFVWWGGVGGVLSTRPCLILSINRQTHTHENTGTHHTAHTRPSIHTCRHNLHTHTNTQIDIAHHTHTPVHPYTQTHLHTSENTDTDHTRARPPIHPYKHTQPTPTYIHRPARLRPGQRRLPSARWP